MLRVALSFLFSIQLMSAMFWSVVGLAESSLTPLTHGVLIEVNRVRQQNNRLPLAIDSDLTMLAQDWSEFLIESGTFKHRPDLFDRMRSMGLSTITENIWQTEQLLPNQNYSRRIVEGWLNSPAHAQNVLSSSIEVAGIGASQAVDGRVVVVFQGGNR